ncbi:substrate-binding domain-containing protein [Arcticibacter svalbardensis]|nr:substrate-binding domain-containing protein [Arcticibacter svalbardensis]
MVSQDKTIHQEHSQFGTTAILCTKIAGFTNSTVVDLFNPPITAIRQPAFEMGQAAMELLIQLIETKKPITEFETRVSHTDLIINNPN